MKSNFKNPKQNYAFQISWYRGNYLYYPQDLLRTANLGNQCNTVLPSALDTER